MKPTDFLIDADDFEDIVIGFLTIHTSVLEHQLFYDTNKVNHFHFERVADFVFEGEYFRYYHSVFKGYHWESETTFTFFANKSHTTIQKKEITELFIDEGKVNFLLNNKSPNGYIMKSTNENEDFSLILLPKHIAYDWEKLILTPQQEIYYLIESYE